MIRVYPDCIKRMQVERHVRRSLEIAVETTPELTLEEQPFVNQRDPARRLGPDGKPAVSRRAPLWADVPDEKWNDWRWQLSNRVNDLDEIEQILNLTEEERDGLSAHRTSSASTSRRTSSR